MVRPPSLAGATHVTAAAPLPNVALTPVGAPGTVPGDTKPYGSEDGLSPMPLVAMIVKVYAVPLVRPETTAFLVVPLAVVTEAPPGDAVTVYLSMASPPLSSGASHVTVAERSPKVAFTFVGAVGAVAGLEADDGAEGAPAPTALEAKTVNV